MPQPLRKILPIETLLRWHRGNVRGSVRARAKREAKAQPDGFTSRKVLCEFLRCTYRKEWNACLLAAGVVRGPQPLTRDECSRVMLVYYTRRGEKLVKKWELAERQVGTFRKK